MFLLHMGKKILILIIKLIINRYHMNNNGNIVKNIIRIISTNLIIPILVKFKRTHKIRVKLNNGIIKEN